jgi:hypothetical protein
MIPLRDLGQSLANNHIKASMLDDPKLVLHEGKVQEGPNRRVVVIVGAGASLEAGMCDSKQATEKLRNKGILDARTLQDELDLLEKTWRLSKPQLESLETLVVALSTTVRGARATRRELQSMFTDPTTGRYLPLLGYEILAHGLKHRFIDAIVNYNVDELLDQSIADELRPGEYHHIVFDGDCPKFPISTEFPLERPYYIKPHGTVSHPSSLRFTREDYYRLPDEIVHVMRALLTGCPLDLLVIGFSMQSFELIGLLNDARPGSRIFYVAPQQPTSDPPLLGDISREQYLISVHAENETERWKNGWFSAVLEELWREVTRCFREPYAPRNIARHELLPKIFPCGDRSHGLEQYLFDRTVLELAMAIAKGRGFLMMTDLGQQRAGEYYVRYRKELHRSPAQSFLSLCERLGLCDIGYGRETLRLGPGSTETTVLTPNQFREALGRLVRDIANVPGVSPLLARLTRDRRSEILEKALLELYEAGESEIRNDTPSLYAGVFKSPQPLVTRTSLHYFTNEMLREPGWNSLHAISESGEWLRSDHVRTLLTANNRELQLRLVLADTRWVKCLQDMYGPSRLEVRTRKWWNHNRHITLVCDPGGTPMQAIYFSRRFRASEIRPMRLCSPEDSAIANEIFEAYWQAAENERSVWIGPRTPENPRGSA